MTENRARPWFGHRKLRLHACLVILLFGAGTIRCCSAFSANVAALRCRNSLGALRNNRISRSTMGGMSSPVWGHEETKLQRGFYLGVKGVGCGRGGAFPENLGGKPVIHPITSQHQVSRCDSVLRSEVRA
jgi:hypothetical protein